MKKSKIRNLIRLKNDLNNKVYIILSLEIVILCIFLNSFNYVINFLPSAIYFSPKTSAVLIVFAVLSVSFLIMSIGYNSICFFSNSSKEFDKLKLEIKKVKVNNYRIQRSTAFLFYSLYMLIAASLSILNISGRIDI
jgi:hypothetical protein